jgi:hypothetical protein
MTVVPWFILASAAVNAYAGAWKIELRSDPIDDSVMAAAQTVDAKHNKLVVWCSSEGFTGTLNAQIQWEMSQPYKATSITSRIDKAAPFVTRWASQPENLDTMMPYSVSEAAIFIDAISDGETLTMRLSDRIELTTSFDVEYATLAFDRLRQACQTGRVE